MKLSLTNLALASTIALAAVACADATPAEEGTSNDEVVVGIKDLQDKVAVFADRLEFDGEVVAAFEKAQLLKKIERKTEPVYLVGDRQSGSLEKDGSIKAGVRNPRGYLRKAVSYKKAENGNLVVMTEPATIAEAIEDVKRNGLIGLDTSKLGTKSVNPLGETVGPLDNGIGNWDRSWNHTFGNGGDGFTPIDLSGRELFRRRLLSGGEAVVRLSKGKMTIKPTVDAHVLIQSFIPKSGHAILTTDVDGEVEIEATADGAFELQKGDILLSKSFGGTVSGVPLTLGIDVKWNCGLGVNGRAFASVGATAHGSLRAGAEFEGTNVKGILDKPTYELKRLGPVLDADITVRGACHLITEISVQLFDTAGPQAQVDVFADLQAQATGTLAGAKASAVVKAGVNASVGGSLRPFGIKIADITAPPFSFERELFNGEISIGKP